ncbi:hypothetical protein [Faecalibaculum rodentium]|uniref:hypothetical protein n=1 Tax=Faecalibaculum rodentium TaxID=1702221 RepID=UPI003F662634
MAGRQVTGEADRLPMVDFHRSEPEGDPEALQAIYDRLLAVTAQLPAGTAEGIESYPT